MPQIWPNTYEDFALRCGILLIALALDWVFGEPDFLWRRFPHPVVLFGRVISTFTNRLNGRVNRTGTQRKCGGVLALFGVTAIAIIAGWLLSWGGMIIETLCLAILLAGRSLDEHIRAVGSALNQSIAEARTAVGMIVGRSTDDMSEDAITRAAIETGAENLSDGVIAPAFWFLALGLPGLLLYKMTNTADSMIGYKNARFYAFGWAAAKFDDLLNYIPARLTALLLCITAMQHGNGARAVRCMLRDAKLHASPNAGWPEAAMAGALNIWLAGPRAYGRRIRHADKLNPTGNLAKPADINRSLHLLKGAQLLFAVLVFGLTLLTH